MFLNAADYPELFFTEKDDTDSHDFDDEKGVEEEVEIELREDEPRFLKRTNSGYFRFEPG